MRADKMMALIRILMPKFVLMFLRGTSMVSKFLLLVVMGRYLSLGDIGVYGLILGAAVVYTQAAGWGFGFHLNRHMVTADAAEQQKIFAHQWGIFFYTYLATIFLYAPLLLPGAESFTHMNALTAALALFLMLSEHASNELGRLLIATKRTLKGNMLLFLRAAGWAFPVAGLLFFMPESRSLTFILAAWCLFSAIAFVTGMWWCREYIGGLRDFVVIPMAWMRTHIGPSLTIYVAFLVNAVLMYLNRFTVGAFLGIDETGLYTLYWSVVNALYLLAQTGFIQTSYPAMIAVHKDPAAFRQKLLTLNKHTAIFAVVSGTVMAAVAPFLFALMGKAEATDNLPFFYALLGCGVVKLMATVSFYALYARHDDKALMTGMLATLALGVPVSVAAVMTMGLWGSAFSEGFFALSMLAILIRQYRKVTTA